MLLTIENQTAEDLEIGFPIARTLGPNGDPDDAVTLGVSDADLRAGEDKGDPAYKRLDLLKQQGAITIAIAPDPSSTATLDSTSGLGSSQDPHVNINSLVSATAEVARYVCKSKGTLTGFSSVIPAALAVGDVTLTATKNGGAGLGVLTIAEAGSAAGDVDEHALAAPESVEPGDVIELTVGGTNTADIKCDVTLKITPAT